jgi:hypothetical protein
MLLMLSSLSEHPFSWPADRHIGIRFCASSIGSFVMYRSDIPGYGFSSTALDGNSPWNTYRSNVPPPREEFGGGALLVRSPREAMHMAESSGSSDFFPTVTITLTTLLWPGTAH